MDSLEQVLFNFDKSRTSEIVNLAEKMISATDSDQKKCYYLGVIITSYASQNEKQKSVPYLYRAKEIAEKTGDPELICRVYITIASLNESIKLNSSARVYLEKAEALAGTMPNEDDRHKLLALVYNEWGSFYYSTGEYQKSNDFYKLALDEFAQLVGNTKSGASKFYKTSALYHYGRSFLFLNKPDSAKLYLNKAMAHRDTTYASLKYMIKTSLAEAYTLSGDPKRAIDTLLVITRDPNFDMNELKAEVYLCLSKNYRTLGNVEQYALYNDKYLEVLPLAEGEDLKAINTVMDAEGRVLAHSAQKKQFLLKILLYIVIALGLAASIATLLLYRRKKRQTTAYESVIQQLESKLAITAPEAQTPQNKTDTHAAIPKQVEQEILDKLERFEASGSFLDNNLTISSLAVQLDTNTTYLSEIINRNKGKNFNSYINGLRINYICGKIYTHPEYRNYKISYLATECGFTSHSAFATVFKNVTGISPSVFLKQAQKAQDR